MPRKTKEVEKEPIKKSKKIIDENVSLDNKDVKKSDSTKSSTKKQTAKTSTAKKQATKISTTKKQTTKKSAAKTESKTDVKKASSKKVTKKEPVSVVEYYDLPYRYNQTIVKILAQTPQMLFVYWDISDVDRSGFEERYGEDFFSKTKPVLIVHNKTMNYSFEIEINDFANSWYLHVNDANCKYEIELGRRPYEYTSNIQEPYIHVSSSNYIDAPNNRILFDKFNPAVTYKNTKNGAILTKDFSSMSNYKNIQKIYNIYDLYKQIYKDEIFNEILTNPSNPSSIFKK